jgi:hypothetical protein
VALTDGISGASSEGGPRVCTSPASSCMRASMEIACFVSVLHAQLEERSIRIILAKNKIYNRSDQILSGEKIFPACLCI